MIIGLVHGASNGRSCAVQSNSSASHFSPAPTAVRSFPELSQSLSRPVTEPSTVSIMVNHESINTSSNDQATRSIPTFSRLSSALPLIPSQRELSSMDDGASSSDDSDDDTSTTSSTSFQRRRRARIRRYKQQQEQRGGGAFVARGTSMLQHESMNGNTNHWHIPSLPSRTIEVGYLFHIVRKNAGAEIGDGGQNDDDDDDQQSLSSLSGYDTDYSTSEMSVHFDVHDDEAGEESGFPTLGLTGATNITAEGTSSSHKCS
jgi:hypothetical protein